MTKTVEAIYESGVLRPLETLALPNQQRVRVTVETIDLATRAPDRPASLHRLLERLERSTLSYGGKCPAREEFHERDRDL